MLSFGIEYERAFSIAFWSARLFAGSAPPSLAATMIARESFVKSWPRFASAAPFLCLIDDHLLCPDTRLLSDQLQKTFVDARVVRQLGVERRDEETPVAQQHGLAVVLGQHLDVRAGLANSRCADEDAAERLVVAVQREIGLERRHLPPVRVPVDDEVDEAEVLAVEHDHPGAGPEDRRRKPPQRLVEAVEPHQPHERGR